MNINYIFFSLAKVQDFRFVQFYSIQCSFDNLLRAIEGDYFYDDDDDADNIFKSFMHI